MRILYKTTWKSNLIFVIRWYTHSNRTIYKTIYKKSLKNCNIYVLCNSGKTTVSHIPQLGFLLFFYLLLLLFQRCILLIYKNSENVIAHVSSYIYNWQQWVTLNIYLSRIGTRSKRGFVLGIKVNAILNKQFTWHPLKEGLRDQNTLQWQISRFWRLGIWSTH